MARGGRDGSCRKGGQGGGRAGKGDRVAVTDAQVAGGHGARGGSRNKRHGLPAARNLHPEALFILGNGGHLLYPPASAILTTAGENDISPGVKKLPPLNIVLYQPEIPQNTGNVGRSCLAAGAHLWLVRPLGFRVDEKHLRRAGLDYWQHLSWTAVDDWQEPVDSLPVENHWYSPQSADTLYPEASYQPGDSLVFGCETAGLPPSVTSSRPDRCLRIPIHNPVRSLNLASAVAVGTFEVLRQWREHGLIPRDF